MIIISNKQRDDIVRYLTEYLDSLKDTHTTRAHETRRLGKNLLRVLNAKKPVALSELPEQLRNQR